MSPAERGSRRRPGGMQKHDSQSGRTVDRLILEVRGRLDAVLQELEEPAVDWDVVQTILEGTAEDVAAAT